ncbi:MAG: P-loop NTPase [Clostridia bacterium]|nr:P-loop NTPase [Clostridia bacterium]
MKKTGFLFLDEVHIRLVLLDLLKNAWLAVLAAVTVCIGVFAYEHMAYKPSYTCQATFSISPKSTGAYMSFYSSMNTTTEMAEVFHEVFTSDVLKRMIREDLSDPDLNFSVASKVVSGTNILSVSTTADSAWQAQQVMQSLMKNYPKVSGYLFGRVVLDVLKYPRVPTAPSNPFATRGNMVKAALVSVLAVFLLIAALSVLRPTVKTVCGAKRKMGEGPLGVLPVERRKRRTFLGKRVKRAPLVTDADISFHYTEAALLAMHGIRHKMDKNGYKTLLITSVAENEGKSTVSANLALSLFRHGHRVALVDLDLRRPSIMKILGNFRCHSLGDALKNGLPKLEGKGPGLFVFSDDQAVAHTGKVLHSSVLRERMKALCEQVDYLILDSAPYSAVADTGMLLELADCCVMVVRQDWTPHKVCKEIAEDLDKDRADYLGYVLNCYRENRVLPGAKDHYGNYSYYGRYGAEVTR